MRNRTLPTIVVTLASLLFGAAVQAGTIQWRHLSTVNGDLPVPNSGNQQTSILVCDIDIWLNEGTP